MGAIFVIFTPAPPLHVTVNDKTREVTKSVLFDIRDIHGQAVPSFNPHTMLIPKPGMLVFEAPGKKEDVLKRVVLTKNR